ncbi:MAG TPA: NUDIX hydrolase [Chloroflexota bacterium]
MKGLGVWQFRLSRYAGRLATRLAAILTLGRMPPFVSTSVVVADSGSLLVVLDPIRHEHILPGGHLRWSEDPALAAIREVREETGMDVELAGLLGVYSGLTLAGEMGVVRIVYAGKAVSGELRSSAEGDAMWIDLGEYAASSSRDARIVRDWIERRETSPSDCR